MEEHFSKKFLVCSCQSASLKLFSSSPHCERHQPCSLPVEARSSHSLDLNLIELACGVCLVGSALTNTIYKLEYLLCNSQSWGTRVKVRYQWQYTKMSTAAYPEYRSPTQRTSEACEEFRKLRRVLGNVATEDGSGWTY